jgi:CubicO group peptidase (beta-lactamase class C family)
MRCRFFRNGAAAAVAAVLSGLALGGCRSAQQPSHAGTAARELIAACSDQAVLDEFAARSYAPSYVRERGLDGLRDADRRVCTNSGGLRMAQVAVETRDSFFAFADGAASGHYRISVLTNGEGKIVRRSVAPALPAPDSGLFAGGRLQAAALDRYLDRLASADQFSGVVLVARGDEVVYLAGRGSADRSAARPVTAATQFGMASIGKMFTATAIAQLVERGELRFTSRLIDVLPDFPNRAMGEAITIEQLLTHTSGLPMFFDDLEVLGRYVTGEPISSFLPAIAELRLAPAPRAMYSNAGYLLLGAVIETVSGMPFDAYVRRHVFAPAGMTSTTLTASDPIPAAVTYTFLGGDGTSRNVGCGGRCGREAGSAAGGGYTTATDLFRFLRALTGGRLVSSANFASMAAPRVLSPWGTDYGFGLAIERIGPATFVGHAGDYVGTNTEAVTDGEHTLVVLSNYERPAATGVADAIKGEIARARIR